jgi:transposase
VTSWGVDTHKDTHMAAVVDGAGRLLVVRLSAATMAGHQALLDWLRGGWPRSASKAPGSTVPGLSASLRGQGVPTLEADRPDRTMRRLQSKSDPVDAEAAARAVLARRATGIPKAA